MTTTVICPNCGYKQGPTAKCRMCSTLFDYHYAERPVQSEDPQSTAANAARVGIVRRIFQLLTGSKGPAAH